MRLFLFLLVIYFFSSYIVSGEIGCLRSDGGLPRCASALSFRSCGLRHNSCLCVHITAFSRRAVDVLGKSVGFASIGAVSSSGPITQLCLCLINRSGYVSCPCINGIRIINGGLHRIGSILRRHLNRVISKVSVSIHLTGHSFSMVNRDHSNHCAVSGRGAAVFRTLTVDNSLGLCTGHDSIRVVHRARRNAIIGDFSLHAGAVVSSRFCCVRPGSIVCVPFTSTGC